MKKLLPAIFLLGCVGSDVPSRNSIPVPPEVHECQTEEFTYELRPIRVDSSPVQFIHKTVSKEHTHDVSQFNFEQIYIRRATLHGDPDLGFIDWIRVYIGDEAILWVGLPAGRQEDMGVDGSINIADHFDNQELTLKGVSRGHAPGQDTDVWMAIDLVTVDICPQDQTVTQNDGTERKNSP